MTAKDAVGRFRLASPATALVLGALVLVLIGAGARPASAVSS